MISSRRTCADLEGAAVQGHDMVRQDISGYLLTHYAISASWRMQRRPARRGNTERLPRRGTMSAPARQPFKTNPLAAGCLPRLDPQKYEVQVFGPVLPLARWGTMQACDCVPASLISPVVAECCPDCI